MTNIPLSINNSGALAAVMQPFVDRGEVAGAVALVADKDAVLCLDTAGYADIAAGVPMRPDTLFWIASQSKPITATALMMLVDEGKVEVEAPITQYLPEFNELWLLVEQDDTHQLLHRPAPPVTVRHLLTHTSGMPFSSAMEQPTRDMLPLHVAVRSYAMTPLQFAPGSKYMYSNAGINTAARIIEVVSGIPYETFLDERLLRPLGMTDTTFWPNKEQLARLAKAYRPAADGAGLEELTMSQLSYPLDNPRRQPMPAGGLFSTATDCATFCRMVLNGGTLAGKRYLSEAAVTQMTTRQTDPALSDSYGFGWSAGDDSCGHGGAFATNMEVNRKHGLVTVYLVQHVGFPGAGGNCQPAVKQRAAELFG